MSHFSAALQTALAHLTGSRKAFATNVGIPVSTFHNYVHGDTPPTLKDLGKIVRPMDQPMQAYLVTAHLRDQVPPSASDFIRILNLLADPTMREAADAEYSHVNLPPDLKRDFDFLASQAVQHPEVADMIVSTASLLRGR